MPVVLCTSFAHGLGDNTSLTKGNAGNRYADLLSPDPAVVLDGSDYWLEVNTTASAEYLGWDTNTLGTSKTRLAYHVKLRFPSSLPAANSILLQTDFAAGAAALVYFNQATGKLAVQFEGVAFQDGPTISAATDYYIELHIDCSANPHVIDWVVNDVAQTQLTRAQAASTILDHRCGTSNSETFQARYRDLVVWSDTADIAFPVGRHKVVLLKPDTGGTTAEIGTANATGRMVTNSAIDATHNSANILAATSEIPPLIGATATGVGQRTSGAGNACGIPMTTYALQAGETVAGGRAEIVGWAGSATANNIGLRSFNGTTETILFAAADPNFDNNTTSPAWLCKMLTLADFDTQGELDAMVLRIGYSTDIAPLPGAHALYVEMAIKLGAAATSLLLQRPLRRHRPARRSDHVFRTGVRRPFEPVDRHHGAGGHLRDPRRGREAVRAARL